MVLPHTACAQCINEGDLTSILAERLSTKLRRHLSAEAKIIAVSYAGVELASLLAQSLSVPFRLIYAQPIYWPKKSQNIVGAVTGTNDIIYMDKNSTNVSNGASILAEVQSAKFQCMKNALERKSERYEPSEIDDFIVLVTCMHAAPQLLKAAMLSITLKTPKHLMLVTPFLPLDLRNALKDRVNNFIFLREIENNYVNFTEHFKHLSLTEIQSELSEKNEQGS